MELITTTYIGGMVIDGVLFIEERKGGDQMYLKDKLKYALEDLNKRKNVIDNLDANIGLKYETLKDEIDYFIERVNNIYKF